MAAPVLVRAYTGRRSSKSVGNGGIEIANMNDTLPPISSFAFADILRAADSADFRQAIDGIAEICAKNRMSLADEYASHLPPLGEITATNSSMSARSHLIRPGARRALTSVPEASSGSSEGSRKSKQRAGAFAFRRSTSEIIPAPRRIRIGSNGRTIANGGTTALASDVAESHPTMESQHTANTANTSGDATVDETRPRHRERTNSEAQASLERLLASNSRPPAG